MPLKPLPLREHHAKLGAVFGEAAGWEVPLRYGEVADEHAAVRHGVGIGDLSHRGKLSVTGEDKVKWLQSVISNDVLSLTPGTGVYSGLLTHKGKMLSYFRVYVLSDAVMLEDVGEVGDATYQSLRKFLLYGTKAKLENCADTWGLLLVSGPKATELIQAAFSVDVGSLQPLSFILRTIGTQQAMLIRSEETGEFDVEILLPIESLAAAWDALWEAGRPLGLRPFGAEARQALRIEAGLPHAGAELNEEIVPPEANLEGKAFSLSKGCYPGQEVVARMDTYGSVRRRLAGLVLHDPVVPPKGAKIFSGDREVGWVSSSVHSPTFGCSIALGFPLRDFAAPGTALTVEIDGERHDATVRPLPFYTNR
jgi:glycine cleavage system T protein